MAGTRRNFVGGKRIAAELGISIQRFKQLIAEWHAPPSAGAPDYIRQRVVVLKNEHGQYELTPQQMTHLRNVYALVRHSRSDSLHDPKTGKIVGKTFRDTRRDRGLPTRARKTKPTQSPKAKSVRPHEPIPGQARLQS
jgi:hypothetical protein